METPISVVDVLRAQRAGGETPAQPQLPSNPLLRGLSMDDPAALARALFGANANQADSTPPAKADTDLDWLLKDTSGSAAPQNSSQNTASNQATPTQTPSAVNLLSGDQHRQFKANFALFDQHITPESIASAITDAYKPGGGLQPITVPPEILTAFAAGDFSGLSGLLHSAQLSAHQNAMSGVLNLLNSVLPNRMSALFDSYSSHADEVSARASIAEQHSDPILQLALDAALHKYKVKFPNATAAQLKAVGDSIAAALRERLAPKATDAKPATQPTGWDEFFKN